MSKKPPPDDPKLPHHITDIKEVTEKEITRRTILSFAAYSLLGTGAVSAFLWIKHHAPVKGAGGGVQGPLRKVLDANEKIFDKALSDGHFAKTFLHKDAAGRVRLNTNIGAQGAFDPETWKLEITRGPGDILSLDIGELKRLPKTEIVFDFKCVEGWSQVSWWGGVRFSDLIKAHGLEAQTQKKYVGLSTPDNGYYVGLDMASAMHPQTLLCYEMTGQPIPINHGAPLRLIIPVKYGIKNLKRVGHIYFSDERPPDYWYERGYDYFAGL